MNKLKLTALFIVLAFIGHSQTKNFIDQPYIEVNGSADTLITPNEIYIRILLSEKDTRDRTSVEELEAKMVDALKSLGINTEKDLSIKDMYSNYKTYLLKSKDVIKTKQYILKVTDAATASKVFMKLEDLDISNTSVAWVDHSDLNHIKNIMRIRAVEDAKNRAMALTIPLNQLVGPAILITDNDGQNVTNALQGRVDGLGLVIRGVKSYSYFNDSELPKIDFEQIKVSSSLSVKFILK
jgi:hypothetical protein